MGKDGTRSCRSGTISAQASFSHKVGMSPPEPPSFHLRLPPELKAKLEAVKGRNSLNKEIIHRLELSLDPDPALQVAAVLRPILAMLDEPGRTQMATLLSEMAGIMARPPKRGR